MLFTIPKKEVYINLSNDNTVFRLLVIPVSSFSLTGSLYTLV